MASNRIETKTNLNMVKVPVTERQLFFLNNSVCFIFNSVTDLPFILATSSTILLNCMNLKAKLFFMLYAISVQSYRAFTSHFRECLFTIKLLLNINRRERLLRLE